jgi:hypothetical protein
MNRFDFSRAAARSVDPYGDPSALEVAAARFARARVRQQTTRVGLLVTAVVVAGIAVGWVERSSGSDAAIAPPIAVLPVGAKAPPPPRAPAPPAPSPSAWLRVGGTDVVKLDDATELEVTRSGSDSAQLQLRAGGVRIAGGSQVHLTTGRVDIRAQRAVFSAQSHDRTLEVSVEHGTIDLAWPGEHRQLAAGASMTVSTVASPSESALPPVGAPTVEEAPPAEELGAPGARDPVEELLRAADASRRNGDTTAAIAQLRRATELADPRRPTVLFTLGKLLLGAGRADEAAGVFAEAAATDPHGLLIEDSLAREIEAWAAAHQPERAQTRARAYLARYPHGLFRDAVIHWSKTSR